MARRVSKRKRPEREDYMLKEALKIEEGVFDIRTMMALKKFFTKGIIGKLDFLIGNGKESSVYLADSGENIKKEFVAVKIFKIETSSFQKRSDYMIGDPRFKWIKGGLYDIINEWCKKEYSNLKIAEKANVYAPKPYMFNKNVLAMEFIENNGSIAPLLKKTKLDNPEKALRTILSDIGKLYANGLVHADISEYNILIGNKEKPYIIDFGQAVLVSHPKADAFLDRDVTNILRYFREKYAISLEEERELTFIRNGK